MAEYKLSYTASEIDEKLKRIKEGNVGYTEPEKVFTWDGDFDDTELIFGALYACKITDKYMDLNSVESFVVKYDNGDTKTLTASECIVQTDTDTGMQVLLSVEDGAPYVFSSPEDVEGIMNKGVYLVLSTGFYVEKIIFAEIIHPIDLKYLPTSLGNVLQVLLTGIGSEVYTASVSFDEAVEFILGGKYLDINYVNMYRDGTGGFGGRMDYYAYSPDNYDKPTITMERYSNMPLYWTPDGISNQQPSGGK